MKINDILLESYSDAKRVFSQDEDTDTVSKYLDMFKDLTKRNVVKGQDKDIGKWIKSGWDSFKAFVDSKKEIQTNSQAKKAKKKDSIVVYEDEGKMVVVPLTKDASCYYGRQTQWCTASTKGENEFVKYFISRNDVLFYVLMKDGNKYAAAYEVSYDSFQYFDEYDNDMPDGKFEKVTGISEDDMMDWYESNRSRIQQAQDINTLSEDEQLEILKEYPETFEDIKNPTEKVQWAGISVDGDNIRYIEEPTEEMQMLAVEESGMSIADIENPTEKVKLAAVISDVRALRYIKKPSDEMLIAAIEKHHDGLGFIMFSDFELSEKVQLVAVRKDKEFINKIENPSEKAKKLHKQLWGE